VFCIDVPGLRLFASALEERAMSQAIRSVRELHAMVARRSKRPRAAIMGAMLMLLACVACGSAVDVKAVRDPSYAGHVRILYLAVVQGGLNAGFANGFVDSFRRETGRRGVTLSSRVVAGTEMDRKMVYAEVAASHADAALVVRAPHGITDTGEVINLTWEVSLFDAKTGSTVWHAQVENKEASGMTEGMVDATAASIVEHLDSAHLLGKGD
jgi:hypothetical protein